MYCGGGHFEFSIGIKNKKIVEDLPKLYVFCSDMKFKMAATAGLSLTLDPMRKMFQNTSSLKPLGQLKPNCPEKIIGRYKKRKVCRGPSNEHSCTVWL
jgi:hypothetical protein